MNENLTAQKDIESKEVEQAEKDATENAVNAFDIDPKRSKGF